MVEHDFNMPNYLNQLSELLPHISMVHFAANLLKGDFNSKKWKSLGLGEKQITVVLQLEKQTNISSIDIGNENSAFIEILVSKSSMGTEDYKVLLAATSLMTLKEAKFSTNINAVKFIKKDDLCEDTRNDKWDRVKVVCTQHYNNVTQFGLSFIVFHTDEVDSSSAATASPACVPDLGKFHLKPSVAGQREASVSAWSLAKKKDQTTEHRGAAAVNAAVRGGDIKLPSARNAPIIVKVSALSSSDTQGSGNDDPPTPTADDPARKPKTAKAKPTPKGKPKANPVKRNAPPPTQKDSPKKKVKVAAVTPFSARPRKPFNRLMEDVVFVISGFQNPYRSDIRNSALAMGAKYKADWDSSCTHLICAFANTPKFNQVRGQGKIVKKDWIEKCYESRKRLPWRRYALDTRDLIHPESEEEVWEDTGPVATPMDNRRRVIDSSSEDDEVEKEVKRIKRLHATPTTAAQAKPTPPADVISDDESSVAPTAYDPTAIAGPSGVRPAHGNSDSEADGPVQTVSSSALPPSDIYDVDTEDDEGGSDAHVMENLPRMPSFFESYNFLILDDIEESTRVKLKRYIAARLGNIISDVQELNSSEPTYCVTEDAERFEEVKEVFPDMMGVRPDWIWFCHDENCLKDASSFSL